ncbi:MAG: hypothetical protein QOF31_5789 [Mycobacterium sp.]|jgi:hypothetical protein|nr:hypothetical protein [Mycobacterium sp.]
MTSRSHSERPTIPRRARVRRRCCHNVVTGGCESGELTGHGLRPFVLVKWRPKPLSNSVIRAMAGLGGQVVAHSNPVSLRETGPRLVSSGWRRTRGSGERQETPTDRRLIWLNRRTALE